MITVERLRNFILVINKITCQKTDYPIYEINQIITLIMWPMFTLHLQNSPW